MTVPNLFVVAGPNGSGKSLFSKELTNSDFEVFDGDKHMTALIKEFPETGSEALWSYINDHIFCEQKLKAITGRLNYAFETNFSATNPMASVYEFQQEGRIPGTLDLHGDQFIRGSNTAGRLQGEGRRA